MDAQHAQTVLELGVYIRHYQGLLAGRPRDLAIVDPSRTRIDRQRGIVCFTNGDSVTAMAGSESCVEPAALWAQYEVDILRVEAYYGYQQAPPVVQGGARIADLVVPGTGEIPDLIQLGAGIGSDLLDLRAPSQLPMTGLKLGLRFGGFLGGPIVGAITVGIGVYLEVKHPQSRSPKLHRPDLYGGRRAGGAGASSGHVGGGR